ncbi:MAG: preprotein translocase subunit SecG [Sphingomonadales bacterium]|nr:preprotein translocase subunit SecG [Sphingomonadales bacterium]
MFIFLTVVQALIAAALVGVILMQRSEGGGLGVGGSPSGFMSARGAADFLTRSTAVLATLFVLLSIILAALAAGGSSGHSIDTTLDRSAPVAPAPAPAPADPLAGAAQPGAPAPVKTPGSPSPAANDPLAGAAKK